MTQKNKYRVIAEFTGKYSITVMCKFLSMPRSSYYYWLKNKDCEDKDASLVESIREGQRASCGTYGYRRMTIWLNRVYGIIVNSKRVRRVMKEAGLQSVVRKKKKFKKDQGAVYKYDNLLARNFYSSRPNDKMVTDITYISTGRGKVFLSMVKDLFDNSIRGYCVSRNNDLKLVADTLRETFTNIKTDNDKPVLLHSAQGFQYTSKLYERLTSQYGITPSMSRKGNCFDNAAAENFFSHLKSELINRVKLKDYEEAKKAIDDYIRYYNNKRIQVKLKMAPLEYRSHFEP